MINLAEIADVQPFSSPKKLVRYPALVPRVHVSGRRHDTGYVTNTCTFSQPARH